MDGVRQRELIAEVLRLAEREGLELWLRGGWAMDFSLGRITRPHVDIDWFCWSSDAATLTGALLGAGYTPLTGPQADLQLDFAKDGEELSFALLGRATDGAVIVPSGPHAGAQWPTGMLGGPPGRIDGLTAPIITVAAQIEIKEMMPVWVPDRPRRQKDIDDIRLLRAASS